MEFHKTLDFWSDKYNGMFQLEPEPFEGYPVTPRSTFLFSYCASPMVPCSMDYSGWYHLPNPFDLASYLRFMMLPVYFAWGLDLDKYLDGGRQMVTIEELLEKVDPEDIESCEGAVSNMREVVRLLDQALEAKNDSEAFETLRNVETMFNNELAGIGGWSFEIKVYDNPAEVGEHLADNYDPDEWDEDDWGKEESAVEDELQCEDQASYEERQRSEMKFICENAASEPEKGKILLALIRRTHMGMD